MEKSKHLPHHIKDPDYIQDIVSKESAITSYHCFGKSSGSDDISSVWTTLYYYLDRTDAPPSHDHANVSMATIWQGLRSTTTAHGIPHVTHAKGTFKNAFWCTVVAFTVGCLFFNYYAITKSYMLHSVDVTIRLQHKTELVFPAVTFCNMNPIRRSTVDNTPEIPSTTQARRRRKRDVNPCDPDWYAFNDVCFLISTDTATWSEAANICLSYGANLSSILSQEEQDFVNDALSDMYAGWSWIGLSGSPWIWTDGSGVTYTNWYDSTQNSSTDSCVAIADKLLWKSKDCTDSYQYVCKKVALITRNATTVGQEAAMITSEITTQPAQITTEPAQITTKPVQITTEPAQITTEPVQITTEPAQITTKPAQMTSELSRITTAGARMSTEPETTQRRTTAWNQEPTSDVSHWIRRATGQQTTTEIFTRPTLTTDMSSTNDFITPSSVGKQTIRPSGDSTSERPTTVTGSLTSATSPEMSFVAACCTCCFLAADVNSGMPDSCNVSSDCSLTSDHTTTVPDQVTTDATRFSELVGEYDNGQLLTEFLAKLSDEDKFNVGFSAEQLIVDSKYAGFSVPLSDFELLQNPVYGNCYVFNSGWNPNVTVRNSSKTGRRYGLHVILNVNQYEYLPESGDTAGIRLVIHPQNRMPFPEDEGFNVSPGYSTSIGIKQVQIKRQGPPFGDCIDPNEKHPDLNVYEGIKPVSYSSNACKKTCYQRHVISLCGCGDPYLPLEGQPLSLYPVPACSSSNVSQESCKNEVKRMFNDDRFPCNCFDSCRDTSFSFDVSIGMWPSNVHRDEILEMVKSKIGSSFDITQSKEYKKNLVKVEIYYEDFNFELISERPAYTVSSYLSNIGGVLGLWIGFSVMTLTEFLEFFLDVIVLMAVKGYRICQRIKHDKKVYH